MSPISALKIPTFKPPRDVVVNWNTWRKGLNTLLRENELDSTELVVADNLLLVGSGVPTKRWGSANFFLSAPTGTGNFLIRIKDKDENQQVVAMTDWGILTKKSGASYTVVTGASWPSGERPEGAQLGDNLYIVSQNRELVRYDFTNLVNFATLSIPTGVLATNLSGASGSTEWSWRITAVGKTGGETTASTPPVSLASMPQDLRSTLVQVSWTKVSAASGDIVGYNIYRGTPGSERWVGGTDVLATSWLDYGAPTNDPFRVVPTADTTGGPKAKYIIRFQYRLILAGVENHPTRIMISGRYPDQERFDWYAGGGFIEIEPDSGQHITGLGIFQEKLVGFKENSVWQVTLNQVQFGQYLILNPQYKLLTASQGCSSHRSIVPVENDLMFSNRKGIYILRYEPQLLTVLNANEISAKIRPFFEGLSNADLTNSAGVYIDKKYILSFPNSKKTIEFDRERLSFMGPWKTPFGIQQWHRYVDTDGIERWVAADADDNYISEFSKGYIDDKGTTINTTLKTKKEDMGDWTIFKTINEIFMNLRYISGTININIYIEDRDGNLINAKTISITGTTTTGTSGIGTDQVGTAQLGLTNNIPTSALLEVMKKTFIYKTARLFQIEIRTNNRPDNYELLGFKTIAVPQGRGNAPSAWTI